LARGLYDENAINFLHAPKVPKALVKILREHTGNDVIIEQCKTLDTYIYFIYIYIYTYIYAYIHIYIYIYM
jgi:hypothetical protein